MRFSSRLANYLALAALLFSAWPRASIAKSYSSGGGKSYSSSSSHSSSSGSSHSSSGSSRTSSSGGGRSTTGASSKSFTSSSGKSYSASSKSDTSSRGYTSSKSYSAGSGLSFSPGPTPASENQKSRTETRAASPGVKLAPSLGTPASKQDSRPRTPSSLSYDSPAARARKEEASRQEFTRFKESTLPPAAPPPATPPPSPSYRVTPPPLPPSASGSYRRPTYVPDTGTVLTRPGRAYTVFAPYVSRPVVVYRDSYNSFFWWWLLDRSLDDRAAWAYHHRYDMDPARYQALVANNQQLEERITQLETQEVARNPSYTPSGLDHDLMYSDQHVATAYSNRPTASGRIAFWVIAVPLALGAGYCFIWLIFLKRWQPAT